MKKISTTALSKNLDMSRGDLFDIMVDEKLIFRKNDQWNLTKKGQEYGGESIFTKKHGEFIVWPPDFDPLNIKEEDRKELINATKLGEKLGYSAQKMNRIFTEIGWIEKGIKGQVLTSLGRSVGGLQFEASEGGTYVKWPLDINSHTALVRTIKAKDTYRDDKEETKPNVTTAVNGLNNYRDKYPGKIWAKDGHKVKSRGEALIDNALYEYGLAHAYERRLPIEEDVWSDFYITSANGGKAVYIEYWGMNDKEKYLQRKEVKRELYKKYDLNLIELEDQHIENLDVYLPKMLLRYGIKVD